MFALAAAWRGARWLDANEPGWEARVTRPVRIGHGNECIMGQVFEHDARLPAIGSPEAGGCISVWARACGMPGPWASMEWQQAHGFNTDYATPYETVDAAWATVLAYRRKVSSERNQQPRRM